MDFNLNEQFAILWTTSRWVDMIVWSESLNCLKQYLPEYPQ
jgi:hypothetical protein